MWAYFLDKAPFSLKYVGFVILIFGVPIAVTLFVDWNPVLGYDNDGYPAQMGWFVVAIPYWTALFYAHKYKTELNKLKTKN